MPGKQNKNESLRQPATLSAPQENRYNQSPEVCNESGRDR